MTASRNQVVLAVEGAIGQPEREYVSRRSGVSGCGGEVSATTLRSPAAGIRQDCRGSPPIIATRAGFCLNAL